MVKTIQLDLLPMTYYNTLGFDKELIDYIDFVDDSIVYEIIAPLYKDGGRVPKQPISQFRAHYLYFIKPEITSYRHLERVLKNPKNQDFRNFIATPSTKDVPSHNCMSDFRKKVGIERFYQIMFLFITQALKVDEFIDANLTSIDSRPLYANTAGPKRKRCDCQDKKSCNCPKTYTDLDAKAGVQRKKTNMHKYFVGYKKHTIICRSNNGPVPLLSIVLPANIHDVDVLLPLIEKIKQVEELDIEYLVADLGYYDKEKQIKTLVKHDIIVTTGVKSNVVLPDNV
ncbi:transposase, partial [Peptococcaceae bacterium]|nr:transposase [Peptococcaceae bacterium]